MIKNSEPVSMSEALEFIKEGGEKDLEIIGFIKKFNKLTIKDAKALKQELEILANIKMKTEYIIKIIDTLPETPEELNKIFIDVSLDEDETRKILDSIKKFK